MGDSAAARPEVEAVAATRAGTPSKPPTINQPDPARFQIALATVELDAWYGKFKAIASMSMSIAANQVTAIIGPSGCGKSTFLRCLNRMHETVRGARVTGSVLHNGEDVYAPQVDPVLIRRRIGMVFQKPNPFPTMSIAENALSGVKLNKLAPRSELEGILERSLRQAALWDEVKDKLNQSGTDLSGGQQQRLCIARALAVNPEVILMDEPCSALDPVATHKIEDLVRKLRESLTIVIVTHNMQQAARVSDRTAFFLMSEGGAGELVEYGETQRIFTTPVDERTEAYITGRFG